MFKTKKMMAIALAMVMIMMVMVGCTTKKDEAPEKEDVPATDSKGEIILATTTSTDDSGLLEAILPEFTKDTKIDVKVVAVGTGDALKMGVNGEADVLLVHSRPDEDKFVENGDGGPRYDVMYNDFVLVGPKDDPAQIKGMTAPEALKKIAESKTTFVSRGDDSGTHKKELSIWKVAGMEPVGDWYVSSGMKMGEVLQLANDKLAYTLADRATYLSMKDKLDIEIVLEGDTDMLNPYGVIAVNPEKNENINAEGAKAFVDWMISEKGQKLIGEYGVAEFGQQLFVPDAK